MSSFFFYFYKPKKWICETYETAKKAERNDFFFEGVKVKQLCRIHTHIYCIYVLWPHPILYQLASSPPSPPIFPFVFQFFSITQTLQLFSFFSIENKKKRKKMFCAESSLFLLIFHEFANCCCGMMALNKNNEIVVH